MKLKFQQKQLLRKMRQRAKRLRENKTTKLIRITGDVDNCFGISAFSNEMFLELKKILSECQDRLTIISMNFNQEEHYKQMMNRVNLQPPANIEEIVKNIFDLFLEKNFPNLDILKFELRSFSTDNHVKKFDSSRFPELQYISFVNIGLGGIVFSEKNKRLNTVKIERNQIEEFDVSRLPCLGCLDCNENNINNLVLGSSLIFYLKANNNNLRNINLSQTNFIENLSFLENKNKMNILDISNNPCLMKIEISPESFDPFGLYFLEKFLNNFRNSNILEETGIKFNIMESLSENQKKLYEQGWHVFSLLNPSMKKRNIMPKGEEHFKRLVESLKLYQFIKNKCNLDDINSDKNYKQNLHLTPLYVVVDWLLNNGSEVEKYVLKDIFCNIENGTENFQTRENFNLLAQLNVIVKGMSLLRLPYAYKDTFHAREYVKDLESERKEKLEKELSDLCNLKRFKINPILRLNDFFTFLSSINSERNKSKIFRERFNDLMIFVRQTDFVCQHEESSESSMEGIKLGDFLGEQPFLNNEQRYDLFAIISQAKMELGNQKYFEQMQMKMKKIEKKKVELEEHEDSDEDHNSRKKFEVESKRRKGTRIRKSFF